jgi:hypothetical protein
MIRSTALAALLVLSCAHGPAQPTLAEALRLEIHVSPTDVFAATPSPVRFELRNIASIPVEFCQLDAGVSMWAQHAREVTPRPLKLHSLVLDAACYERTRLSPGEAKTFEDTFAVWRDQTGDVDLLAGIRVSAPRQLRQVASVESFIRADALRLSVRPAV